MRKLLPFVVATLAVAIVGLAFQATAQDKKDEKPKYTIGEVMEKAHEGGLLKKVQEGKASETEKKELLAMYMALHQHKAPKGDDKEFHKKTEAMVAAAKSAVSNDKDASDKLMKAVNCTACHKAHRD